MVSGAHARREREKVTYHAAGDVDQRNDAIDQKSNLSLQHGNPLCRDADDGRKERETANESTVAEGYGRAQALGLATNETDGETKHDGREDDLKTSKREVDDG